jgi:NADH-quinone oxidoreductase subunit H
VKVVGFAFAFVWIRAALPRFRYDQVMELGWKRLIPLSLAWMLLVAGFMISATWGIAMAIVIVLGSALLGRSFLLGDDRVAADRAVLPPVGARPVDPADIRRMSDGGEA